MREMLHNLMPTFLSSTFSIKLLVAMFSSFPIIAEFEAWTAHGNHQGLREGILKVGAKRAGKLENETEHDEWFSGIGHAPMADLYRLYSKVCHHYLVPLLSQVPLDSSLFKRDNSYNNSMAPPETVADKNGEDGSENSKENMDPLMMDLQVCEGLIDTIHCSL